MQLKLSGYWPRISIVIYIKTLQGNLGTLLYDQFVMIQANQCLLYIVKEIAS